MVTLWGRQITKTAGRVNGRPFLSWPFYWVMRAYLPATKNGLLCPTYRIYQRCSEAKRSGGQDPPKISVKRALYRIPDLMRFLGFAFLEDAGVSS